MLHCSIFHTLLPGLEQGTPRAAALSLGSGDWAARQLLIRIMQQS
jgi:hypothetical protein